MSERFNPLIGLEDVQRAAYLRLFDELNPAIAEMGTMWESSDQALAHHTGLPYLPVEVEQIAPENFYEGHRPSLIQAPVDKYPNISVWAVRATANPESMLLDHQDVWNVLLYVEIMCKSETDEGIVNKRVVRTTEAVNIVMQDDPTLGDIVTGFEGDVTPSLSDVFTRKERTNYGAVWYWQGARLEYVVRKDSVLLRSNQGSEFRAHAQPGLPDGMTVEDLAAIDQS
jgi:hypothetical protein